MSPQFAGDARGSGADRSPGVFCATLSPTPPLVLWYPQTAITRATPPTILKELGIPCEAIVSALKFTTCYTFTSLCSTPLQSHVDLETLHREETGSYASKAKISTMLGQAGEAKECKLEGSTWRADTV